jgi:preprotein translocase subunit SecG
MNDRARTAAAFAAGTAALSWPLVWNRYAFTYWDTVQYVTRFATRTPSLDRPIFYSIVVWCFSRLPAGLLVLALFQAAVTSALLLVLIRESVARRWQWIVFALSIAAIALTPNVFHVVMIMPDIATLWLAIALALVAVARERRNMILGAVVITAALVVHNSNLPIVLMASPILLIARRGRFLIAPLIACAAAIVAQNGWMGAPPLSSPTTFFVAARMNQTDGLINALAAQGNPRYVQWSQRLAPLRREPEPFLWQTASPLRIDFPRWDFDVAQFRAARAFLAPVVAYGLRHDWRDLLASGKRNLGSLVASEYLLGGYNTDPADREKLRNALQSVAPHEARLYAGSREGRGERPVEWGAWRRMSRPMSGAAAALAVVGSIIFCFKRERLAPSTKTAVILSVVFVANVLVCGLLSSPQTRYIERVFALPIVAVVIGITRP